MKKPWSISTTVRNPERLRDFLQIIKMIEGEEFNKDTQIKYQILLIQNRLYKPTNIEAKFKKHFDDISSPIPYEVARKIFDYQNYEDPPMRGRQSVNPLNKLGFSIARENAGKIKITELGNRFLNGNYDIGFIFFKSFLKLQFPNPWSVDFSEKQGFNINPFISMLHLINNLNKKSDKKGLSKTEFSIFVPTLINANFIANYIDEILNFRKAKDKDKFILSFLKKFYKTKELTQKQINNLFDYGDNTIRYFRLTKYFKVIVDALGSFVNIDLEPLRLVEIQQLLNTYNGEALKFDTTESYLKYLSDIDKPILPWQKIGNLNKIAKSLAKLIQKQIQDNNIKITDAQKSIINKDISKLNKIELNERINELRKLNLQLNESINKNLLVGNLDKIKEIISIFSDKKKIQKVEPLQFEKLTVDAFKIINDEIQIRTNYPVDDNGEPISHAPGNKADAECYYQNFKATIEVTLNTSKLQWVVEGQPIMRHLRDFENQHSNGEIFCIFIAPKIHDDTYSQYWFAVKYEYGGTPQKIVPLTTDQFVVVLETLLELINQKKRFYHTDLQKLYSQIINETKQLKGFPEWKLKIPKVIQEWKNQIMTK